MSEHENILDDDDVEGKVFIGGLSWQTTEATLRAYFEKFGELAKVSLMTDKRNGQPRGFAFVTMVHPELVEVILSQEHNIDGRKVDVKKAVPREKAPVPKIETKKIFVGGLHGDVNDVIFREYFSKFGEVKDAVVMVDRTTNRSRGFGFVSFENEESVEQVMKTENRILNKWVEVKKAEPKDLTRHDSNAQNRNGANRNVRSGDTRNARAVMGNRIISADYGYPINAPFANGFSGFATGYATPGFGMAGSIGTMGYGGFPAGAYSFPAAAPGYSQQIISTQYTTSNAPQMREEVAVSPTPADMSSYVSVGYDAYGNRTSQQFIAAPTVQSFSTPFGFFTTSAAAQNAGARVAVSGAAAPVGAVNHAAAAAAAVAVQPQDRFDAYGAHRGNIAVAANVVPTGRDRQFRF